jgi:hypothetical protein
VTTPYDEHEDRAAATLNPGRRIRITDPMEPGEPREITDADTGAFVIELPSRREVDAFIARYGCVDTDANFDTRRRSGARTRWP